MCVGKPFLSNTSWGRSRRATSNGLPSVNVPLHHLVLCNGADVSHDTPSELRPILYEQPQCQISRNAPCSPGSRYKYGSLQTAFTLFSLAHARTMTPGTGGFARETDGTEAVKGQHALASFAGRRANRLVWCQLHIWTKPVLCECDTVAHLSIACGIRSTTRLIYLIVQTISRPI